MKRPYLKEPGTKIFPLVDAFYGLDTSRDPLKISKGRAAFMKNISALSSPAIRPREGRTKICSLSGEILFFGVIEGKYLTVVEKSGGECVWKYYDGEWVDICAVEESGKYDMLTFLNKTILVTGRKKIVSGIEKMKHYFVSFDEGTKTCGSATVMPPADMAETINGRIALAYTKNDKLYLGGIMDSDVWFETGDGLEQNVITQNGECGSGLKTFGGHLVYFKPHSFGEIYGNSPDTYTMFMVSESCGCLSDRSLVDCGRLLWLSDGGILSYGGGALPSDITGGLRGIVERVDKERAKTAAAGTDGRRYIICLPVDDGDYINCILNLQTGEWYTEDDTHFLYFANMGGKLYAADSDGDIYLLWDGGSDEEPLYEWSFGVTEVDISSELNLKRFYILCDIEEGGFISAFVTCNFGEDAEETIAFSDCAKSGRQRLRLCLHPKSFHGRHSYKLVISGKKSAVHSVSAEGRSIRKSY